MLAAIGKKIAIAGTLGSLAAFGGFASAADPSAPSAPQNQQRLINEATGAAARPQVNGGQQAPAGRQNSVAPQRVVAKKVATENMTRPADHEIAQWLMVCNNEEIQMAKLAEQHADHQKVKDFAKQMQTEHTQAWQQLEQFAMRGGHGAAGEHVAAPPRTVAPASSAPVAVGSAPASANAAAQSSAASVQPTPEQGGLNYLEIHKQVAAQAIASANRDMGAKHGAEFDKAYIGCQIGAHYKMIDTNRVLREYASPELQKTLDQSAKAAEHHLAEAKDIMKSLEQK